MRQVEGVRNPGHRIKVSGRVDMAKRRATMTWDRDLQLLGSA